MLSVRVCLAVLFFALAGCTTPYLPARPGAAAPARPGVVHTDGFFNAADGLPLYEQSWRPNAKPKGVLVIVHGLKDHSSRYAAFADELVDHGYAVYAFDLRGHGRSAGERVYVQSFDQYLDDLDVFLGRVRAHEPGEPLFLFGHSMGGAIVTLYSIARQPYVRGVILSGAVLRADAPSPLMFGTRVIASIAPSAGVFNVNLADFSRDPAVVREGLGDPLVYQPGAPAVTARELLYAIDRIDDRMEGVHVPLLVLHGTADRVTPPDGSRELAIRAYAWDKTLKLYEGLFHDLLHEPEHEKVTGDILAWLDARAAR